MVSNKPPYDATVENIRALCEQCRDVSQSSGEDLEEIVEDLEGSTFNRNLEAAVLLGFFEQDDDGLYTPTKRGKMIGYGPDDGQETEIFRDVIRESDFYNELLEIVGKDLDENDGERYLKRDKVMKQIGINFDFGVGDRTIESASGVFLKILDAAGLGSYKEGRGGYPTRLEINDEYTGFVESLSDGEKSDQGEDEENEESTEEQLELGHIEESADEEIGEESKNGNAGDSDSEDSVEEVIEEEVAVNASPDSSIEVEVNIDISSEDWESEEVVNFIDSIQSE